MKDIIIISAGKFAREVYSWVQDAITAGRHWQFKGFLDDRIDVLDDFPCSKGIISSVESYHPECNDLFICAIGDPILRKYYVEGMLTKGGQFAQLIHPTVVIGANVRIGEGVIIAPYSVLTASLILGNYVNLGCSVICSHHNEIGDWSQISGHASLAGYVRLGKGVFVGSGAVLVPNAVVGDWSYVGAGSVVLRRVAPYTKVFGNPAQKIGTMPGPPGVVAKKTVTIP